MITAASVDGLQTFSLTEKEGLNHFIHRNSSISGRGFEVYWREDGVVKMPDNEVALLTFVDGTVLLGSAKKSRANSLSSLMFVTEFDRRFKDSPEGTLDKIPRCVLSFSGLVVYKKECGYALTDNSGVPLMFLCDDVVSFSQSLEARIQAHLCVGENPISVGILVRQLNAYITEYLENT